MHRESLALSLRRRAGIERLDMHRGIRRTIGIQLVEPDEPPAAEGLVEYG